MNRWATIAAFVALSLAACRNPVMVAAYTPYEPPPIYQEWYDDMVKCSSHALYGGLPSLRWFRAEAVHYDYEGEWRIANGVWIKPWDIVIRAGNEFDEHTVKHEMLHALLQEGGHPEMFDVCGVR